MKICGDEYSDLKEYVQYIIDTACHEMNIDTCFFTVSETKEGCSAWILEPMSLEKKKLSDRAFNIVFKSYKTKPSIYDVELKSSRVSEPPKDVPFKRKTNEFKRHIATIYHFPLNTEALNDFLIAAFKEAVNNYKPKELFGCCSKYLECSDQKKCLHENSFYHKVCCWYRKSLDKGRIFYGENRNID